MPRRNLPLVTGEIYHIFNKGVNGTEIFSTKRDYQRAIRLLEYYRFITPPLRYSRLKDIPSDQRIKILNNLNKENQLLVTILSYCLMPNHFHLLVKQVNDIGISKFMSQFQNSYARYFNTRHGRAGPLFLGQFKAKRITNQEILLHAHRYIQLNPYSSFIVKDFNELKLYPWSSFPEYLDNDRPTICDKEDILSSFKSPKSYTNFVLDHADYQRNLELTKHFVSE